MMRVPWRTTFGLAALVSCALALTTIVIGLGAYYVTHEALEIQLDHRIATETHALLAERGEGGVAELAALIRQRDAARSTASLGYILVDMKGRRLAGQLDAVAPTEPGYLEFLHYGEDRIAQSLTTVLPGGERLVVAADREVIDEIDATIFKLFSAAFAAMLVLGVGGAWTVGAMTRTRLRRIDRAAQAIIGGDLRQRMPVDGSGSEFDLLARTLNQMLDRIGGLLDNLRQVSSDVAHDLRTPLTRLHNSLEDARSAHEEGAREAAIEAASVQAQDLLDLFAALLRISEVEAGALRSGFRDLSLSAIGEELIEAYGPDAELSDHRLLSRIEPDIMIHGDPRLLRQLVANLLDNALRHTPAGTTITLDLSRESRGACLLVEDDGPGVDADEASRLFERFSRTERSRSTSGHGLGLALVAAVATIHGGSAHIRSGKGFRIAVRLR
ncbi:MAG TPA: ATP-binding protein [Sphingobium sp.]|uniref:sensor histidine kinase n=1 Tax=Sphingobium sp. TaxID=1912891 RepID=UPI002ED2FA16